MALGRARLLSVLLVLGLVDCRYVAIALFAALALRVARGVHVAVGRVLFQRLHILGVLQPAVLAFNWFLKIILLRGLQLRVGVVVEQLLLRVRQPGHGRQRALELRRRGRLFVAARGEFFGRRTLQTTIALSAIGDGRNAGESLRC